MGSKVSFDGNARHAIAHRSAQANQCMAKWRPVLSSSWVPRLLRLNIVFSTMWQAFLWSSSVCTTVKAQRDKNCELECEDGGKRRRCEKAAMDGSGPVVETMAQNWTSLDRQGQHEHSDCHQRTCAQLGWSCGQDQG